MALAIFGVVAVIFALLLLFQRTLYGSAICLLGVLLQVAAIFFAIGAQLLGLMQVLVYAGAIMVLIVVAVMAAPARLERLWAGYQAPAGLAALVLFLMAAELGLVLVFRGPPQPGALVKAGSILEGELAALLFGPAALVTEAVGVLILVAALSTVGMDVPAVAKTVERPGEGAGTAAAEPAEATLR